MNKKNFLMILFASFLGSFIRFFVKNNFFISFLGSFVFGFVIAKRLSKFKNEILLTGFCSSLTSFSGFIFIIYEFINEGNFIKTFIYINMMIILNICMMYFGFFISRKIT